MRERTTATISLDIGLLKRARSIAGFNISRACEVGLAQALKLPIPEQPIKEPKPKNDRIEAALELMTPEHKTELIRALTQNQAFAFGQRKRIRIETGIRLAVVEVKELYKRLKAAQQPQEQSNTGTQEDIKIVNNSPNHPDH